MIFVRVEAAGESEEQKQQFLEELKAALQATKTRLSPTTVAIRRIVWAPYLSQVLKRLNSRTSQEVKLFKQLFCLK